MQLAERVSHVLYSGHISVGWRIEGQYALKNRQQPIRPTLVWSQCIED